MSVIIAIPIENSEIRSRFTALCSEARFIDRDHLQSEELKDAEVILGNVPVSALSSCSSLKWLQLDSAGADAYLNLPETVTLTNASGAYGEAISEYMLACTMAAIKKLYEYAALQKERDWRNLGSVKTVSTLTVLTIGMGNIASAYAQRMHALGAVVDGIRRTRKEKPSFYRHQYMMDQLDDILSDYDVIAMALPGTAETDHVMTKERLAKTKTGSILINVGRGSAIDETALIDMAKAHHFSHVFLDVFEHEPLPKNNPLWTCRDVTVTPHIAGRFNAAVTYDNIIDIMLANLSHYLHDEPMEHIVNRKAGY